MERPEIQFKGIDDQTYITLQYGALIRLRLHDLQLVSQFTYYRGRRGRRNGYLSGGNVLVDPIVYYNPETLMFPAIAQNFAENGTLDPIALYLILDWKAPRARTKHRSRLAKIAGSFNRAVTEIAADLSTAPAPEDRLGALLTKWGFRLPTASAILTVLYPDIFTVYDVRVCNALRAFHQLGGTKWSPKAWQEYQKFIVAVRDAAPQGLSLRDCDRWLWGKDKQETLTAELTSAG